MAVLGVPISGYSQSTGNMVCGPRMTQGCTQQGQDPHCNSEGLEEGALRSGPSELSLDEQGHLVDCFQCLFYV